MGKAQRAQQLKRSKIMLGTLRFPARGRPMGTQRLRRYPFALPNLRFSIVVFCRVRKRPVLLKQTPPSLPLHSQGCRQERCGWFDRAEGVVG